MPHNFWFLNHGVLVPCSWDITESVDTFCRGGKDATYHIINFRKKGYT